MSGNEEENQQGGAASTIKTEGDEANNEDTKVVNVPVPNSEPRETDLDEDSYTYRDFAATPVATLNGASLHPQSLQAQKLPAKLASMLSNPDLTPVIMWQPHGRSWRVLNRDLFAEHALPRFFGHKNYASFVRIVNAWGFRRITRGPDRDSYYHELFLRGRPDLHQQMKRLSSTHRKTPSDKERKCPNFYELAKTSPLPEVPFQRNNSEAHATTAAGSSVSGGGIMPSPQLMPVAGVASAAGQLSQFLQRGALQNAVSTLGSLGGGPDPMGNNFNQQMLSMLANDATRSMNNNPQTSSMSRLAQLQRDNEELRRRIMEMENRRSPSQLARQPTADRLAALSANTGVGGNNFEQELQRMQRELMVQSSSNSNMNNNLMNNHLLSSLGGGASNASAGNSGSMAGTHEFSFMTGFPREQQLIAAMRVENQMGFHQQQQQPSSQQTSSALERILQHQQSSGSGSSGQQGQSGGGGGGTDDQTKGMMEWVAKQQQQQQGS